MNPSSTGGTSRAPRASTVSAGFVKADSSNLPHMDECMILEYMSSSSKHNIAEIRGAKVLLSSRDSYLESAVGYVEVQRTVPNECIVRAKVTPEHKVTCKNYITEVKLKESEQEIIDAKCDGCAASAGGCKHALVFLFWLSKRSSEPSSTSKECYWKKPTLSAVTSEPLAAENIFKNVKKINLMDKDPNIILRFKTESKKRNCKGSLISLFTGEKIESYNLFDMTFEYVQNQNVQNIDFEKYKMDMDQKITPEIVMEVNEHTKMQVNSKMWHSVRQARITASKIYEASKCNVDGTLVQQILGGYKVPETKAIQRGKKLEDRVIKEVEKKIKKKIKKSGFILINSLVGASPDGVGEDFIIEVKCPMSDRTLKNYINNDVIQKKFAAQMQIQMLAAGKSKGYFCVADPGFETNKQIKIHQLQFDPVEANNLLENATLFWKKYIFPKIMKSAM